MRREFTINFAQFSVINQTGGESPRPSIKIWICHFVLLREAKNLKQNKYKMCETRFFGYRLRMTIGRAWIFSENGHPFVRIRGHFPCQGNNPPYNCKLRSCRFFECGGDFLGGIECQNALGEGVRIGFAPKRYGFARGEYHGGRHGKLVQSKRYQ